MKINIPTISIRMDFIDNILNFLPKVLVDNIGDFYGTYCNKCKKEQIYCKYCELYMCMCDNVRLCNSCDTFNCFCEPVFQCNLCDKFQCDNQCHPLVKVCQCCDSYLCHQCWEI